MTTDKDDVWGKSDVEKLTGGVRKDGKKERESGRV